MAYPHGGDTWGYEGWTFAKTLSHLPRLKTCRLADSNPVDSEDIHGYYLGDFIEPEDSTPGFKNRRIMLQGLSDAGCRRASILCEDPFYTAIVIQKFRAEYRHPVYEKEVLRDSGVPPSRQQ
ncbi:hypothetical protein N8I77_010124 [Diaporthe amygdali]|uniref:Uncharacterized protein n=1 Tax=Phomopsis amygdali TaxID=1214568 RepID=A0AAD9S6A5_PHOAM|nr:hypothetical protein N8I77_010124 [Diaporthe amygdali]